MDGKVVTALSKRFHMECFSCRECKRTFNKVIFLLVFLLVRFENDWFREKLCMLETTGNRIAKNMLLNRRKRKVCKTNNQEKKVSFERTGDEYTYSTSDAP